MRSKAVIRSLLGGCIVLALYAAAGFIAVPLLGRHHVSQALGDLLGREVSIEQAGFNPFTLTAELRGLKVMPAGGGDDSAGPALAFDRLMANFELASLWHGGPVVRELALEGPRVKLARLADSQYDWADVLDRLLVPPETDEEPALFSVANIHVENGLVEVEDRVAGTTHRLSELRLGIPAISRLPVTVDVSIKPDLSMLLDGRPIAAKGSLTPLPDGFSAELGQLTLKDFELAPWLAYLPFDLPFTVPSGVLDLDLHVEFGQRENEFVRVLLRGRAQVNRLAIQDRAGRPVLAAAELEVELADVQPLLDHYYFSRLRLQQPELDLVRLDDGSFNVEHLLPALSSSSRKAPPARARSSVTKKNDMSPYDLLFSSARIRDGLIRYSDHAVKGGFSTRVEGISFDLRDFATHSELPAEIRLDYTTASGEKFSHQDRLRVKPPFEYSGSLTVEELQPVLYGRYYADFLPGGEIRNGRASGTFRYRVAEQEAGDPLLDIQIERLALSDFVFGLPGRKSEMLRLKTFTLSDTAILPASRQLHIGGVDVQGMALAVTRLADGHFDFMSLADKAAGSAKAAPWDFRLDKANVSDSSLRFDDRAADEPAVTTADGIELQLSGLSMAKGSTPADFALRGRINKEGRLAAKGTLVPEPLRANFDLDLHAFPLTAVQPYIAHRAQIGIRTGRLSAKGRLALREQREGMRASLSGQAAISDFSSVDRRNDTDFVRWRELSVRQAKLDLEPFALSVDEIAFDGLFSRLILDEGGRLNLREIQRVPQESMPAGEDESPAAAHENVADVASAANVAEGESGNPVPAPDGNAAAPAPWPPLNVGRIVVKNSNIAFSDRFIRPNYNAFLGNLSGELVGLSSDQASLAKLDLQGRVGRVAPLTIKGEFNPFREDRHLNIEAGVKDFELADLSGYSGRYVGYGINRGKLSATLNYRIEDRKLSAENHIFLDQLTFGDAVDSPDATHLPVRLAVSLLKNARGEIDVKLPVGGTLDDPQFSVFGLVLRAIGGLIAKAVTAPFALLGREELSFLDFDPGSAKIGPAQEEKLRSLVKALEERPTLKLDISGLANAGRDTDGIRRHKLRSMVIAERRKAGGSSGSPGSVELSPEEYTELLGEVYSSAKIKKPRNVIGLARSLPDEEMEKLLLASIDVDEEDVVALARRRQSAVQRWLADQGKIPPERLFQRELSESEIKESEREASGVRFSLR